MGSLPVFGGVRVVCLFSFLCCVAFLFFVYLRFVSSALNVVSVSGLFILVVSVSRLSIHAVNVSGLSILVVSVSGLSILDYPFGFL